ncbi:VCBS domain-containing protein [Synechococcus sp. CBW1108]|uniref:VCBS domain-containing protein n=1 Tax=Synechococcus sp. CBW1108 TaxID=1353147 RepID=UPI0018CEF761|nr:VCBS domain-containing protein [Synechococcus sp. CBW1108]QPN69364.1 putative Ig domain-containing protein [Synechococcus sp. CBW1108]
MQIRFVPIGSQPFYIDDVVLRETTLDEVAQWADTFYDHMPAKLDYDPNNSRWDRIPETINKLQNGEPLRIVMLGDSVQQDTANSPFEAFLQRAYPNSQVELIGSTRGGTGVSFYQDHVEEYVTRYSPDLLMIGGISNGDNLDAYQSLIDKVRAHDLENGHTTEIILQTRAWSPSGIFYPPPPYFFLRQDMRELDQLDDLGNHDLSTDDFRVALLNFAADNDVEYLDMTGIVAEFIFGPATEAGIGATTSTAGDPYSYWMRDWVHTNDYGKQILGRILESYFAPADNGDAVFSISGTLAVGQTLTAAVATDDPDGNGPFSYTWQALSDTHIDGNTWYNVGTDSPSYTILPGDQGKELRLLVSYTDGGGHLESVATSAGQVAANHNSHPVDPEAREEFEINILERPVFAESFSNGSRFLLDRMQRVGSDETGFGISAEPGEGWSEAKYFFAEPLDVTEEEIIVYWSFRADPSEGAEKATLNMYLNFTDVPDTETEPPEPARIGMRVRSNAEANLNVDPGWQKINDPDIYTASRTMFPDADTIAKFRLRIRLTGEDEVEAEPSWWDPTGTTPQWKPLLVNGSNEPVVMTLSIETHLLGNTTFPSLFFQSPWDVPYLDTVLVTRLQYNAENYPAVISGTSTGDVTEDGGEGEFTSGSLSVSDDDSGESGFAPVDPAALIGTYGSFTFESGAWTYRLDNASAPVQELTAGETVTDSLTVQSVDLSASETITVTITGAGDSAFISGTSTGDVTEDAAGNAEGSVVATFSTADAEGNPVTVSLSDTTNYILGTGENAGKVLLTAAGLALVNAGTELPPFTLTPNDGSINGTPVAVDPSVAAVNDAPTLTLISTTAFTEDAAGNAEGSVVATFSTADAEGNPVTVTLSDTTNYILGTGENAGKVLLTAAGLALVNAGTELPPFTLTPNDGSINGTPVAVDPSVAAVNDAPTVASPLVNQSATENSPFFFTVPADTFADADAGVTLSLSATLAGGAALPSWLSFNAETYTFSGTPTIGDVGTISVLVTATDGSASVSDSFYIVIATAAVIPDNTQPVTVVEVDINEDDFTMSGGVIQDVIQAEPVVDAEGAISGFILIVGDAPVVITVPAVEELGIDPSDGLVLLGDPFLFAVEITADADQRPGTQVVISVDLSNQEGLEGIPLDELVYAKYYTQAAIDEYMFNYGSLLGLDGESITTGGWYPFMQQSVEDENGARVYSGDGARFAVVDGNLTLIISLTDNAFGDVDLDLDELIDPGIMYALGGCCA